MDLKIVSKKGKRGRHRWLAKDMRQQNMTMGMSPRDWETEEDAVAAGEGLLEARAWPLREKLAKVEADLKERRAECLELRAKTDTLEFDLEVAKRSGDYRRQRDKRAVIIAYCIVFGAILIGVSCIAINGIFCAA